jgi:endoglycosylceramidase
MNRTLRRRGAISLCAVVMIAALALVGSTSAGAQSEPPEIAPSSLGPIGHDGRWMTTADGRVLMLNGINFVDKNLLTPAGYGFEDDDGEWLAANGIDAVRLGFTAAAAMPTPGVLDEDYLTPSSDRRHARVARAAVDRPARTAGANAGQQRLPEWMTLTHGAENTGTPFPLYYITNPAIQAAFDSFGPTKGPDIPLQDQVATIHRHGATAEDSDAILGPARALARHQLQPCGEVGPGCPDQDASSSTPTTARMTAAIRGAGAEQLIFGEPWVLFNFGMNATNTHCPAATPTAA